MFAEQLKGLLDTPSVNRVILMPGQLYVSKHTAEIWTLLGSCVAACIWDTVTHAGGMNHFMLPGEPSPQSKHDERDLHGRPLRYGKYAMEDLVGRLLLMGCQRQNLVAKVFGGGNIFGSVDQQNVGRRNSEYVLCFLKEEKIRLAGVDLNGENTRRIRFYTETGVVRVEKIGKIESAPVDWKNVVN